MRTLVTGGGGFLGSAVLEALSAEGQHVVALTRRKSSSKDVYCDLAEPSQVCKVLNENNPECVINIAANANFGHGVLGDIYSVNTLAPAIIADYCKKSDALFIHISGSIVHGFSNMTYDHNTPYLTDTDYGISKLLADNAIVASGCRSSIIRFGGIFGHAGPSHLGINRALSGAIAGVIPTLSGSGSSLRNYIYVKDAAEMIVRCLNSQRQGVFYAAGKTLSIREMIFTICDVFLNGQPPILQGGQDSPDQVVNVSPGLEPCFSFHDALEDMKCLLRQKSTL